MSMETLKKQILELIEEKCREDLKIDPTQPVGYDLPALQVELDKLNGVGSTQFATLETVLIELLQEKKLSEQARSYILVVYDNRRKFL
ncbi:hypothetical protein [Mannheimia indoligenes]|uniref:hypothetical protein n=1 Tax=Mannheimia indoligenes TaxID=3103145 RepID=UPI002FE55A0F